MVLILIVSFLSRIVSFSYLCLFLVMLFKLSLIGVSGQNPTSVEWLWSASKRKCSETPYLEQFKFIGSVNYHNIYYIILNYVYGRISVEDIQYFNCSEIHVDQWFNIMETTCGDLEVYRNLYKPFLNVPMNVNLDIFEDDDIEFLGYNQIVGRNEKINEFENEIMSMKSLNIDPDEFNVMQYIIKATKM